MRNAAAIGAAICIWIAAEAGATDVLSDHGMDGVSAAGTETDSSPFATNPFLSPGIQKGVDSTPAATTETSVDNAEKGFNAVMTKALGMLSVNPNSSDMNSRIIEIFNNSTSLGMAFNQQGSRDAGAMIETTINRVLGNANMSSKGDPSNSMSGALNKLNQLTSPLGK